MQAGNKLDRGKRVAAAAAAIWTEHRSAARACCLDHRYQQTQNASSLPKIPCPASSSPLRALAKDGQEIDGLVRTQTGNELIGVRGQEGIREEHDSDRPLSDVVWLPTGRVHERSVERPPVTAAAVRAPDLTMPIAQSFVRFSLGSITCAKRIQAALRSKISPPFSEDE